MSRPDPLIGPSYAASSAGLSPQAAAAELPESEYRPAPVRVLAAGLDHPEGVCWDPITARVIAGGELGQLYAIDPEDGTTVELSRTTGQILGVAADGRGRIVACVAGESAVRVWDGDRWTTVLHIVGGEPLRMPNYAVFAPDATLIVSASGAWRADVGRIVALYPDGRTATVSTRLPRFTNGLAVSHDGLWLYVAESEAGRISRLDLASALAGQDPAAELVVELPGTVPDGIAVVSDGSLILTCYRPDLVFHLRTDGTLATIGHDWQGTALAGPTNACFAGRNRDLLVVANLNRWQLSALDTELRGAPPYAPTRWAVDG